MIVRNVQKVLVNNMQSVPFLMMFSDKKGFKKFQRKPKPSEDKSKKQQIKKDEHANQYRQSSFRQKSNFISSKPKQFDQNRKGFQKFHKKLNVQVKKEHIKQSEELKKFNEKKDVQQSQKKQAQNFNQKMSNFDEKQQVYGFDKFKRKSSQPSQKKQAQVIKMQKQQDSKQKEENILKSESNQKEENKEEIGEKDEKDEQIHEESEADEGKKGFSFGMRKRRSPSYKMDKKKQEFIRLKKEVEREQMKETNNKQAFFTAKVEQFKSQRRRQIQMQNSFRNFLQKQIKKVNQRLGTNFSLSGEVPPYIQNNPGLFSIYLFLMKNKFMSMVFIIYLLHKIFGDEQYLSSSIQKQEPQFFITSIERGLATHFQFIQEVEGTGEQKSNKVKNILVMTTIDQKYYRCTFNNQFKNKILITIAAHKSQTNHVVGTSDRKIAKSSFIVNFRSLLTLALFVTIFISLRKSLEGIKQQGKGPQNIFNNKSKSKRFQQKINVKFTDVMGMQKAKEEIVEFIDFLMNPAKYHELGARIPRGALLTGPPGTGKTMIAKACAGQSNVPFFTISGSEFMEMFVGVGAQRVRDIFKEAKQNAPSIIFIDEIDAVGKKRASGVGGGNDERDNTLNQLLVEMDGFQTNTNVIVFAATNQKDVLDPALTRPGRFDRLIEVDLPDIEGRKQIFNVHLKPIILDSEIQIEEYARRMATLTPGFSGADIKNLCNEAAIVAARNDKKFVSLFDFELATERIIGGVEKKSSLITPQTRRTVAYHECGHGVVSWFMEGANPLLKLTIIPRSKGALGFAQYLPNQNQISTLKQLEDQICVILGGRMAEEIFFKKISTGAYDDLQKAFKLAKAIVSQYGMNEKLGWLSYDETQYAKYYSHATERQIDEEILKIVKKCTERTRKMIIEKRDLIEKLAERLLERQTIDQTIIASILGERPFKASKQYEEYLTERKNLNKSMEQNLQNEVPPETGNEVKMVSRISQIV